MLGVLLHEIEEPLLAASPKTSIAEAAIWLDRAAATVADRIESLDLLLAWTLDVDVSRAVVALPAPVPSVAELIVWCDRFLEQEPTGHLRPAVEAAKRHAFELIERAERLAVFADDLVEETEFDFLFDAERQLFTIGFNVAEGRLDNSYYDTLASEARLASFLAIATGKISRDHWFKLGRSLTPSGQSRALLSWSASMFEYLMPVLIMRAYPGTLLDETYRAVVERQIQYAAGAGHAVGHLRVGVLRTGSGRQLSVPRVRRARPRAQARAGRRSGDRTVRQHPGAPRLRRPPSTKTSSA